MFKACYLYYTLNKQIKKKMKILSDRLTLSMQKSMAEEISQIVSKSPFFVPRMPRWNKPLGMNITNAGEWGWNADKSGYSYIKKNPKNKKEWPEIPRIFLDAWKNFSGSLDIPNNMLINLYEKNNAKLGLHQDKDENDLSIPIVSISLGNSAIFNYGKKKNSLKKVLLTSGSIVVFTPETRLFYHSISKVYKEDSQLFRYFNFPNIPRNSRINITLRKYVKDS